LLARRSVAESLKLPIIAKFVSYAVVGVPPEIMGKISITKRKKLTFNRNRTSFRHS